MLPHCEPGDPTVQMRWVRWVPWLEPAGTQQTGFSRNVRSVKYREANAAIIKGFQGSTDGIDDLMALDLTEATAAREHCGHESQLCVRSYLARLQCRFERMAFFLD